MSRRIEGLTKKATLSKSRFISGLQCEKLLWWQVHEPAEDEDAPTTSRLLDRGRAVGEAARKFLPDGVSIGAPHSQFADRIARTVEAMAGTAPRIYEASFAADGVFVSVDILFSFRAIDFLCDVGNLIGFTADEAEQRRGERPADFGQVYALEAIAICAQRRVLLG